MRPIKMVDLAGQYTAIKSEVDLAVQRVLQDANFIQGSDVHEFENALSTFMDGAHVISCANGTDALQIAMMALDFKPGDEVILPVHTYVATAEVIAVLKLVPVFVDVNEDTFTLDISQVENKITKRTVAIVPVHLYGQCADLEPLLALANRFGLHVIEDAAQSLGAQYIFSDGSKRRGGTLGIIGTTSFFPSKNLGAFGDGGALFTSNNSLAEKMRMIANHGQKEKYKHETIGINSRLDTLQAAILNIKLSHLNEYESKRRAAADYYDKNLSREFVVTPTRASYSTHVFHQYTIRVDKGRDELKKFLQDKAIPSMIYYPIPLHHQPAYKTSQGAGSFPITEKLSASVLSLPIHTELEEEQLSFICSTINSFPDR